MAAVKQYSDDTMRFLQGELLTYLESYGPATKLQIMSGVGLNGRQLSYVLSSQPDWLVGVGTTRSESKFGRLVLYHCRGEHVLGFCTLCGRKNFHPAHTKRNRCHACVSDACRVNYTRTVPGVDVSKPTTANPGSQEKVEILGARLDAGLPLFLVEDEYACQPGWNESQEESDDENE